MKRKFASNVLLTLLFILIFAVNAFGAIPEPMANFYVNDFADVISDEQQEKIIALNEEIAQSGAQIVVATVDFTDGMGADMYAIEMFNQWGIGDAGKDNGALILLAIGEDDYFVCLGTGTEKFISSGDIGVMLDWHLEAYFAAGDYGTGAVDIAYAIGDKMKDQYGISHEPKVANNNVSNSVDSLFYVRDNANVISSETINEIGEINKKLFEENGGQVIVYTVDSLNGKSITNEAERLFNEIGIGDSVMNNGALVFFAINEDDYYIMLGDGLDDYLTRQELVNIIDQNTEPDFAKKNYDASALETVYALSDAIHKYYPSALGIMNTPSNTSAPGFVSTPSATNFNPSLGMGNIYSRLIFSNLFNILRIMFIVWLILRILRPRRTTYIGGGFGGGYYPRRRWFYPWTWFRPRWHRPFYPPPRNNPPPPRNNSGGGFFGSGSGRSSSGSFGSSGGGRTSGGGAGRSSWGSSSSSSGSRSSSSSGRSSSSSSRSSSSSGRSSSSSSRSSGGGGRSSGGGGGRRK